MKTCIDCKETKDFSEFHKNKSRKDGLQNRCKVCNNKNVRKWQAENPEKFEANWRRNSYGSEARLKKRARTYGLSEEALRAMLLETNGICDICGREPRRWLVVDHCHETGVVRGILCEDCNLALGAFRDDVESLKKAIKYLQAGVA